MHEESIVPVRKHGKGLEEWRRKVAGKCKGPVVNVLYVFKEERDFNPSTWQAKTGRVPG